jgi:hypothetical protein
MARHKFGAYGPASKGQGHPIMFGNPKPALDFGPFPDESFVWAMADPPYSKEYAESLYGVGKHYPTPGSILKEACRVLMSGGRVGLLHFQVPMSRKPLRLIGVWGVTTGAGYAIRAWSVFEKE